MMLAAAALLVSGPAQADVHSFSVTAEYQAPAQEKPEEANRHAADAALQRLVEEAMGYLLLQPDIKKLGLSQKELQDYTRSSLEVVNGTIERAAVGENAVLRATVTGQIDPAHVVRRVNAVRQAQSVGC
jgi:hypothetical protein